MKLIEYNHRPSVPYSHNGVHKLSLTLGRMRCGVGFITGNEIPLDWLVLNRPPCFGFTLWLRRLGFGFRWERRDWAWQNGQWMAHAIRSGLDNAGSEPHGQPEKPKS